MEKTTETVKTDFLSELEGKKKIEDKIRFCLDSMRKALSQEKIPAFRRFWQAKRACLELFKEKISTHTRSVFWTEYLELSEEIRRVKEVLDEQSSFAQEQIELAIKAIEDDLMQKEDPVEDDPLFEIPKSLITNGSLYKSMQTEVSILNNFAGRLNSLRKELIHLNLRIKVKNRCFERLSKLGDTVFPRRKELITEISDLFSKDVEEFSSQSFEPPFFERKEEIKALQNFAKVLSLSSPAFSQTREVLSRCWDQIKELEKQKRIDAKEILEKISPQIEKLKEECEKGELSLSRFEEKSKEIFNQIKQEQLGLEENKSLKKKLFELKKGLEEKEKKEREEAQKAAHIEQQRQKELTERLLRDLLDLLNQAEALSLDALVEKWEAFVKEGKSLSSGGVEKDILENRLDAIADHIQEKRWQALSGQNPKEIVSSLHSLLDERHKARRKLKERLELHRKTVGGSTLNLEESMLYQELISEEKLRLDSIETMIEEIEENLFDLDE